MSEASAARGRVFLSYRRQGSAFVIGRLADRIETAVGADRVFRDLDSIPLGTDYREQIRTALDASVAVVVVIGQNWLGERDGGRRIDDPTDLVRIEIESALARDIPVIPVVVQGAARLSSMRLPASIESIRYRNALPLRPDPDFDVDCDRLIAAIAPLVAERAPSPAEQVAALRGRLVTADSVQLRRIVHEVDALRANHPHDPDVNEFGEIVYAAAARDAAPAAGAPPGQMGRPAGMPIPRSTAGARFVKAAAAVLALGLAGVVVAVAGFGVGDGPSARPTVATEPHPDLTVKVTPPTGPIPTTTTDVAGVCAGVVVDLLAADEVVSSPLTGDRIVVELRVVNEFTRSIRLPGASGVTFLDSTGAQIPTELGDSTWFFPFELVPGTFVETDVHVDAGWKQAGRTLASIRIAGVTEPGSFDRCDAIIDL